MRWQRHSPTCFNGQILNMMYRCPRPAPPLGAYGISKTALLGLTKGLALELGPRGVRVNSVLPGVVPTNFSGALMENGFAVMPCLVQKCQFCGLVPTSCGILTRQCTQLANVLLPIRHWLADVVGAFPTGENTGCYTTWASRNT